MKCYGCGKGIKTYYRAYGYEGKMLPYCKECNYKNWGYLGEEYCEKWRVDGG